ncbi:MAG: hypothetical protein U1G08_11050 [Verrucomicrobiota bacterium]
MNHLLHRPLRKFWRVQHPENRLNQILPVRRSEGLVDGFPDDEPVVDYIVSMEIAEHEAKVSSPLLRKRAVQLRREGFRSVGRFWGGDAGGGPQSARDSCNGSRLGRHERGASEQS